MSEGMPGRAATIHDVAARAEVSHQTVSRYLRHNGGLKPATSERIAAAIAELGYTPNLVARSMRTRRSGRVALIMPGSGAHNPGRLLAGASRVVQEAGYAAEILTIEGDLDARATRVRELVATGTLEGILSFAPLPGDLLGPGRGVTVVASADYDDEGRVTGALADSSPVHDLIDGLSAQGHRRFAHITGDLRYASARARRDAFDAALAARGLHPAFVHVGDWSAEAGAAAADRLPADGRPSAVIAANDVIAAGFVRAVVARGFAVPGDVAVTGWDDHPLAGLLFPSLTSVVADFEGLGAHEAQRLIAEMTGGHTPDAPATGMQRIIWRESTGPAGPAHD